MPKNSWIGGSVAAAAFQLAKAPTMRHRERRDIRCLAMAAIFLPLTWCPQRAQSQQVTFDFVGSSQTWVVPANVTSITVDVRGAQGGGNGSNPNAQGGKGGRVQTTLAVTPGEMLVIYVGGRGGDLIGPNTPGPGGFNGGGTGGIDNVDFNAPAGGGGGASDIRQGGNDLSHRVVVAGGGGGAECCEDANGGAGGGTIGMAGMDGGNSDPGGGGTQSSGGAGGSGCHGNGGSGTLGQGGIGGNGNRAGGGGGGGYYGGGGGGGCDFGSGGGGGSSYSAGTNTIHTQGYQTGDGQIVISNVPAAPNPPLATAVLDAGLGDKLLVKWNPPSIEAGITDYQIGYGTAPGNYLPPYAVQPASNQTAYQKVVPGLQPNTPYYVAVRSRNSNTGQVSSWVPAALPVVPTLPVVLVHGWNSNPSIWGDDTQGYVKWLHDAGFPHVWVCNTIDPCGILGDPWFSVEAYLLSFFIKQEIATNAAFYGVDSSEYQMLDIIAHSMGGIISRRYICGQSPAWIPKHIRKLFMMGTPNAGTEAASYDCAAKVLCPTGPASCEMQPKAMKEFNDFCRNDRATEYIAVAGKGGMLSCDPRIPNKQCFGGAFRNDLECPNDGLVSVASVLGGPDRIFRPTDKTTRDLCHSQYYSDFNLFSTFIEPKLKNQTATTSVNVEKLDESLVFADSGQAQIITRKCGKFPPGVTLIDSIYVENSHSLTVVVAVQDSEATFTLLSPSGNIIDSSTSVLNSNIIFDHIYDVLSLSVLNPEAGYWKFQLQTTANSDSLICVTAGVGSDVFLNTDLSKRDVQAGDSITLFAYLTKTGLPLTGAIIRAIPIDKTNDTLPVIYLFDDGAHGDASFGDGIYANYFVPPSDTGIISFNFTADADVGGESVHRIATEVAGVRSLCFFHGDLNVDGLLSPTDVVLELNCVFLSSGNCPICLTDVNCDSAASPSDIVFLLLAVFLGEAFPC